MGYTLTQDGPYTPVFVWRGKYKRSVGPYDGPDMADLAELWLHGRLPTALDFPYPHPRY